MSASFFERCQGASSTLLSIADLQLTPGDCIKLLQQIATKSDALNGQWLLDRILLDFARKQPAFGATVEQVAEKIRPRVKALFDVTLVYFELLISMENGSCKQDVSFDAVEKALIAIDKEVLNLFSVYVIVIALKKNEYISFFQNQLTDAALQQQIPVIFETKSIKTYFYAMIVREATVLQALPSLEPRRSSFDAATVDQVIAKIRCEHEFPFHSQNQLQRDYGYINAKHPRYFSKGRNQQHLLVLEDLNPEALATSAHALNGLAADKQLTVDEQRRVNLQLLAVVRELYRQITTVLPSDAQMLLVLQTVDLEAAGLHWQEGLSQAAPVVWVLCIAVLCLRQAIVYIESVDQRLALDHVEGRDHEQLFKLLAVTMTKSQLEKWGWLGVLAMTTLDSMQVKSYYLGSHDPAEKQLPDSLLPRHGEKVPAGRLRGCLEPQRIRETQPEQRRPSRYLDRSLMTVKNRVLNSFDAWCSILNHLSALSQVLQEHRRNLLQALDTAWQQRTLKFERCQTLEALDAEILQFQAEELTLIWQTFEEKLILLSQQQDLCLEDQVRVEFLQERSAAIRDSFKLRQAECWKSSWHQTSEDIRSEYAAILYYDEMYLSGDEKAVLIEKYIVQQLSRLVLRCPKVRKSNSPIEQLGLVINYLEKILAVEPYDQVRSRVRACVDLYQSVQLMLDPMQTLKIDNLVNFLIQTPLKTLTQPLMAQLVWVTQTDSFYYRWLERRVVKSAAMTVFILAQKLHETPEDQETLKALLRALYYHQALMSQVWFYLPLGWLFGYTDTRKVFASTLGRCESVVSQALRNEAEEAAETGLYLIDFQHQLQHISPHLMQSLAWQHVVSKLKLIQCQSHGFGMVYELRHYLQTQRQQFIIPHGWFFWRRSQKDPVELLLASVNQAIQSIEQKKSFAVGEPAFIEKKALDIQTALGDKVQSLKIQPVQHREDAYFDIWMQTKHPIKGFCPCAAVPAEMIETIQQLSHQVYDVDEQTPTPPVPLKRKSIVNMFQWSRESMPMPALPREDVKRASIKLDYYKDAYRKEVKRENICYRRFYSTAGFFAFVREHDIPGGVKMHVGLYSCK